MSTKPEHIIFSQIKNIGDVILCLPTIGLIKHLFPDCKISLLAQRYTHPIAKQCPLIDEIIDWDVASKQTDGEFIGHIASLKASTFIHLANNKRIARCAYKAGVPTRIGTCQRWYHWLYCNRTINQARRNSRRHELELNTEMLKPLGIKEHYTKESLLRFMALTPPKVEFADDIKEPLSKDSFKLIIHPGSNGHGREWPESHIIELYHALSKENVEIFFTGTEAEAERFKHLLAQCPQAHNVMGRFSLLELLAFINACDGLIASGTGPLHMAAAINKQTLGLFPPRKGISPRRWSPPGRRITTLMHKRKGPCFSCTDSEHCACMAKITVEQVKKVVLGWQGL